jgi:hypothetical protein
MQIDTNKYPDFLMVARRLGAIRGVFYLDDGSSNAAQVHAVFSGDELSVLRLLPSSAPDRPTIATLLQDFPIAEEFFGNLAFTI